MQEWECFAGVKVSVNKRVKPSHLCSFDMCFSQVPNVRTLGPRVVLLAGAEPSVTNVEWAIPRL